jgi:hypothetical protein
LRWGLISGPTDGQPSQPDDARGVPGEFVSADLHDDCARFLDEVRRMIGSRRDRPIGRHDWIPPQRDRRRT